MTINIPNRLMNFIRRVMGLKQGRYFIVLNVHHSEVDYSVRRVGPIEAGPMPASDRLAPGCYVVITNVAHDGATDHTIKRVGKIEK